MACPTAMACRTAAATTATTTPAIEDDVLQQVLITAVTTIARLQYEDRRLDASKTNYIMIH